MPISLLFPILTLKTLFSLYTYYIIWYTCFARFERLVTRHCHSCFICKVCVRWQLLMFAAPHFAAANRHISFSFEETAFSVDNCSIFPFFQWALMGRTELPKALSCPSPPPAHKVFFTCSGLGFYCCQTAQQSWQSLNIKTSFHNITKL